MINFTSANEDIPYIECQIMLIKERTRAARHRIFFNKFPQILTIYIVFTVVRMLKYFPVKG